MTDRILLNSAMRNNLISLQRTKSLIDQTTLKLASGLKINSALDNPQNFFTSLDLKNKAQDLEQNLDHINQSARTLQQTLTGVEKIRDLLEVGKALASTQLEKLHQYEGLFEKSIAPLSTQIAQANPDAYWRLNETSGNIATNQGNVGNAIDGSYINNVTLDNTPLYNDGDVSAQFNGIDQGINIPNDTAINLSSHNYRTVELVFNANTTAGRQVLYEEGANVNSFTIYIDNGNLHVTGRDEGDWGPANISVPINVGETYHIAFTFDSIASEFIGYLNGQEMGRSVVSGAFPPHSGAIAIGYMRGSCWFHDGPGGTNDHYFNGKISDVALYNETLSENEIQRHAYSVTGLQLDNENENFNNILDQITKLANDSSYRGLNLLLGKTLNTYFNKNSSSVLKTQGRIMTEQGLGLRREGFNNKTDLIKIINALDSALDETEQFEKSLIVDINILNIRNNFTQKTISTLTAGAYDMTLADQNEEGAHLLAIQTRQQMGITALSLAAQSQSNVLNLFV